MRGFTTLVLLGTISVEGSSYKPREWDWDRVTKDFDNIPKVQCPDRALRSCDCKSDVRRSMYLVDCGGSIQSRDIHRVPHNTTHLALYQNQLTAIPNGSFDKAIHLLCMDLSYNRLSTTERHAFAGLISLFFLDLSYNLLHGPAVFLQSLSSLRALSLDSQDQGNINYTLKYIVNEISGLKQLEYLDISQKYLSKDDVLQVQNTSITDLVILGAHGVEQDALSSWKTLKSLNLLFHNIVRIPANWFLNNISGLHTEYLSIGIGLSGNANFEYFEAPNLQTLIIYVSNVEYFDFGSFGAHSSQWLDLSYNKISILDISQMQQLYHLDISHQISIKCFFLTVFPDSLNSVDLSGTQICNSCLNNCFLHLEFVDLSNTGLELLFDESFDLCSNVTDTVAIRHLDLQDNVIQCVNSTIFTRYDWSALNVFKLSDNKLGSDPCGDFQTTHFMDFLKPLWNLTDLYLDGNIMEYDLPPDLLPNQTKLQSLHLLYMALTNLTFGIGHLKDLSFLDISHNKIQCLYTSTIRDINTIIHYTPERRNISNIFELNLSHNRLRCTCSCLEFYLWMRNVHPYITFTDLESYHCTFDNGEKDQLSNLEIIVEKLQHQCVSTDWTPVERIVITILFNYILILMTTTLFRFRHTLRYIWLKYKMHREYLERHILDPEYRFDTFISCERTDAIWVKRNFLPKLENEQTGLKFCVAQRDFIVGATIIDNIVRSINQSRKVVYVISQNFLKSGWCKEELLIGHQESLSRGKNILICIFMLDIIHNQLSDRLRFILNHVTCIKWPRDPAAQQVFWIILHRALLDGHPNENEV